jgi:putative PIN family toxin of toxin-antitoxin system
MTRCTPSANYVVRVVFDTVIFVRSLLNPHSIWGRLVFQHFASYRLFVSQPVIMEILEVLNREELTSKFKRLPGRDHRRILALISQAEVAEVTVIPAVSRDPKDDKLLATALAAGADYLVTEDQDLLVLKEYRGIQILTCEAFLKTLE